jgi:hypothetical protein
MHAVVAWLNWSHASHLALGVVTVAGEVIAGVGAAVPWVAGGPRRSSRRGPA